MTAGGRTSPSWRIRHAARTMREGGVIAYPTESVYGLGCDPWNPDAVTRLLQLKRRSSAKGLILIAGDYQQLAALIRPGVALRRKLTRKTARPVTWLVDAPCVPRWIRGDHPKTAVRIVDHPVAAALCRAFGGPIVSTSANVSGGHAARSALKVRTLFRDRLDDIVAGDVGPFERPSEIRDADTAIVYRR